MDERWSAVVQRIVQVLDIQPGDLVLVRDAAGRLDVLLEIALAIEVQGATPQIDFVPAEYRQRFWNEVPRKYLSHWDRHRSRWIQQADRKLVLAGADPDWNVVSHEGFHAWEQAIVVFHFVKGRIERIEAASSAEELNEMFDGHSGEPRRVSHIGLGLNPYLHRPIGWTLVDEHIHGALFITLGENRYVGGQNASSLNVDFALTGATLKVGERTIVFEGGVVNA